MMDSLNVAFKERNIAITSTDARVLELRAQVNAAKLAPNFRR